MPTITEILPSNVIEDGLAIIWANDSALNAGIISLQNDLDLHKATGHPSLYYTKTEIDAQNALNSAAGVQSNLDTHKISSDHDTHNDARYLTVGYLSSIVRTTLNQSIDGWKKFLVNPTISSANPAIELLQKHDSTEDEVGQFSGGGADSNDRWIALQQWISGDYKNVLKTDKQGILYDRYGNKLSTEKYVQDRVKNGICFGETIEITAASDATTQSAWKILPQGEIVGFHIYTTLPGGENQSIRFSLKVIAQKYKLYLQNDSSAGLSLLVVRPEAYGGEPFASQQLGAINITEVGLGVSSTVYVMPIYTP